MKSCSSHCSSTSSPRGHRAATSSGSDPGDRSLWPALPGSGSSQPPKLYPPLPVSTDKKGREMLDPRPPGMAPPGGRTAAVGPPRLLPVYLQFSGLQTTRPDSRLLPGHPPRTLGQGTVLFYKKETNRGLLPDVSSHRKCLWWSERKERGHPPQEAAVCAAGRVFRQHQLSCLQQP